MKVVGEPFGSGQMQPRLVLHYPEANYFNVCGVQQSLPVKTFEELFAELRERARARPVSSATVAALDAGVHAVGKKILEEAGEVWLAAEHEPDDALAGEISQLLYWTQVLMVSRGLTLDDVYRKL